MKLCSDHDLPIWLQRERRELRGILGKDVGDRVQEQATDALRDPEDYGTGDNLGLEDMFVEMTEEEGLDQRTQTQEMDSDEETITDVPNDDDHELFEDYMEIDDTQPQTTRTRGGRVIKRHTHLNDYEVYVIFA